MFRFLCVIVIGLQSCCAVIYHLNESEYQRMPPLFSLDEYESCLVEEGSTYCLLQLNLYAEPGNELMRIITEYSDHRVKHYDHSFIDRGVCVRKTCQNYISSINITEDLTGSLEACFNDSFQREYGLNARVSTLYYCDQHNEPRLIDAWDWTVLLVIFGLVMVNIIGSSYDYIVSKKTEKYGNKFLFSFSVKRNWKRLIDTESIDPQLRDLQFFHGFRVITNMFMVLAHAMLIFACGFIINSHDFEKSFEVPLYLLIYSGMMLVQIFFFISGFLAIYKLRFKEETRAFPIWDVPKIIALRLSRLVPGLAITLALSTTWVRHVGSGPLWKLFVTGSLTADCRSYWWHTLLFVNNYMQDNKYCLIPTWHLAADMQVFLMGVTAYLLTRGRARRVVLGGLLAIGAAASPLHTVLQDLDAHIIIPQFYRTLVSPTFRFQHILGHNNIPCFIIGMGTAALIYDWKKKGVHLVNSRWYSSVLYLSVAAIPLVLYSPSVFYSDSARASVLARAAHVAAVRTLLGLACALAAASLSTRTPTFLLSVLEWRNWVVASRLTYCVFLLHIVIVHVIMGSRTQLSYFSGFNLMVAHFSILLASYLVSVPFYLMVEAPFTALFKNFAEIQISKSKTNGLQNDVAEKTKVYKTE